MYCAFLCALCRFALVRCRECKPAGKSTPQSSKPGSGALQVNDLSAEAQRIVALEHEVRQLKAQARMAAALNAGSIGPGSMSSGGDFNGDFLGAGVIQGSSTSYTPKGSSGGRFQHRHTESPGFPEGIFFLTDDFATYTLISMERVKNTEEHPVHVLVCRMKGRFV